MRVRKTTEIEKRKSEKRIRSERRIKRGNILQNLKTGRGVRRVGGILKMKVKDTEKEREVRKAEDIRQTLTTKVMERREKKTSQKMTKRKDNG